MTDSPAGTTPGIRPETAATPTGSSEPPEAALGDTPPILSPQNGPCARDHRHPLCPRCGVIWHQAGNRTGHCSACHRTFDGLSAFEAHITGDGPDRHCIDLDDPRSYSTWANRLGDGPHDTGTIYWRLLPTPEQAARFERLNAERRAEAQP